jgi:hypothetical protein
MIPSIKFKNPLNSINIPSYLSPFTKYCGMPIQSHKCGAGGDGRCWGMRKIWSWIPMGLKTKNYCAGEGQEQLN